MTDPALSPARAFALLDRDGTLIVDRVYLSDPDRIEFLPGVLEGLHALRNAGFGLAVITNQSGIARGYFDRPTLDRIHQRLTTLLAEQEIALDGIYVCPHGPDDDCDCRKPRPGLIREATKKLGIDLRRSVFIGDTPADMGAARAAGVRGIQILAGANRPAAEACATAKTFTEAAVIAIEQSDNGVLFPCT